MAFCECFIQVVWEKATSVSDRDPYIWRKDECGAWIRRLDYSNRNSEYGWEIDRITPHSMGGTDKINNLRPLQWENSTMRQSGPLVCVVTANGKHNYRIINKNTADEES